MRTTLSARELLNALVRSANEMSSQARVGDSTVYAISATREFQMTNLADWCKELGRDFQRVDWNGNETCNTNHDMIYFDYAGCRFFQLVSKEDEKDERQ